MTTRAKVEWTQASLLLLLVEDATEALTSILDRLTQRL